MSVDYYKILQVPTTASQEEIEKAYHQLIEKWQKLRAQQAPEIRKRSDKIITLINEAYQALSIEKTRALYDKQVNKTELSEELPVPLKEKESLNKAEKGEISAAPPKNSKKENTSTQKTTRLIVVGIIILVLAAVISYVLLTPNIPFLSQQPDQALTSTPIPSPKPQQPVKQKVQAKEQTKTKELSTQTPKSVATPLSQNVDPQLTAETKTAATNNTKITDISKSNEVINNTITPEIMNSNRLKNANNTELKETAIRLAEITNNHKEVVINTNTQFIEAKASNQNVTLNFMVIDGIANSKIILDAYLTERFMYDNQICKIQKDNIAKGILFTFAYYNTNNELIGKYYIDQEVCNSPMEKRLVKVPDEYQLNSIEIGEDGKPIDKSLDKTQETSTNDQ